MSTTTPRAQRRLTKKISPDRLSAATTLAWTTTGFSAAVNFIVLGYWVFYATDVLALDPVLVGSMALVSKLLEAVAVVFAGWIVDRSPETRWGKARPYELAIVGLWAATWFLFSAPDMGDVGQAIWVFVGLVLVNVIFTTILGANDVLYTARAFQGRVLIAKVSTRTGFFTVLGTVAANVALPLFVAQAGSSAPAWSQMMLFVAIPLAVVGLGRFVFVKEKYPHESPDAPKVAFRDILSVFRSNRYIWVVAFVTLASQLASGSGITIYYFRYIVGDVALMSVVGIVPILVLPLMLVFPWMMRRMPVSRIITLGAVAGVLGGVTIVIANGNFVVVLAGFVLIGLASLPVTFLVQLLIIDNAAYNQWSGNRRLESTMGAINTFCMRLGSGLAAAMLGWALGLTGYDGTTPNQPAAALTTIVVFAGAVPAVLWLLTALVMRGYRKFERLLPTITEDLAVIQAEAGLAVPADDASATTDPTTGRTNS